MLKLQSRQIYFTSFTCSLSEIMGRMVEIHKKLHTKYLFVKIWLHKVNLNKKKHYIHSTMSPRM